MVPAKTGRQGSHPREVGRGVYVIRDVSANRVKKKIGIFGKNDKVRAGAKTGPKVVCPGPESAVKISEL